VAQLGEAAGRRPRGDARRVVRRADGGGGRPREEKPESVRALRDTVNALVERPEVRARISPGFYFQRCLSLWRPGLREIDKERKAVAVEPLEGPGGATVAGDLKLHEAVLHRQASLFTSLRQRFDGLEWQLRSITPFVTGIGSPHPLENGFAFLKPYGVPYLAGSGLKGSVRAACAAVWTEQREAQSRDLLRHYFGSADKRPERGETDGHRRGALVFMDLFPAPGGKGSRSPFRLDVVNPHYGPYYQGKDVPADWHSPVPSYFLTLRADLEWRLRVIYAPLRGEAHLSWVEEISPGLELALTEAGLGAKKAWGYGLFAIDARNGAGLASQTGTGVREGVTVQTETRPVATPQKSAAARALADMLPGLRANTVKPSLSAIEQHLRGATAEERVQLLAQIEQRLVELRLSRRDVNDTMKRLRAAVAPAGE
jgi:CRISPR type III-B/RAMP module RAMP protein Cmr6